MSKWRANNRGKRRWTCDDCGRKFYLAKIELGRAAKPSCPQCGCTRLIESAACEDEMADVNDAKREQSAMLDKKMNR